MRASFSRSGLGLPRASVISVTRRAIVSTCRRQDQVDKEHNFEEILSKPTWSVNSLLPSAEDVENSKEVTPKQLHHLLRLSALQPPSSPEEEARMLNDLKAQLHFVKEIQKVDTTGIEPLRSIRDESAAAEREQTITLDSVKHILAQEEVVGKIYKRIRRRKDAKVDSKEAEDWDVLAQAPKKVGRYFVVDSHENQNNG